MKATILVDGVKYTGELVEKKGKFRAKKDGKYWLLNTWGSIVYVYENNDEIDNFLHLTGNYFATKEETEAYKAYLEALGRVTHAVYELNDGWEPDWSDRNNKWCVYFEFYKNSWDINYDVSHSQYPQIIPYLKSEDLAEKLIKDHRTDLEVIRKYKV